ncbi:NUDIX hydrolase domain-like protein (chloroplast) [Artemisia annua]|uniref:NUDIX hydrolase domain-like protein n=1 Tax=Artemisia annua TaxID=35608 RepID=A0A2U1PJW0_ARTAN|nr:NUDIX hydrolase domain-like protein [Artemisia annua]
MSTLTRAMSLQVGYRLPLWKNLNGTTGVNKLTHSPQNVRSSLFKNSSVRINNVPVVQARFVSSSEFKVDTVEASDTENEAMSPVQEIGVGVFILNDNKVLFGRRRSLTIAANSYAVPGGHLECGESFEECAAREVKEETGLDINNIELLTTTENVISDALHLRVIYMSANLSDPRQTPQNIEPDKCEGWEWHNLKNLPEPMFGPLREMLRDGFNPFPVHSLCM